MLAVFAVFFSKLLASEITFSAEMLARLLVSEPKNSQRAGCSFAASRCSCRRL